MNAVALVVDDEVQIRRLLRLVLEAENYKVHEAETGQQALMEVATRRPDIVLLDLGLPDVDGLAVLKRLREWSEVPVVDLTAHVVTRAGREIKLTATEYALLRLFVKNPGRVLTHRYILREIWGPKSEEHRQYLRVYVTHLRQKIERDPTKPSLIQTQAGIGYRFAG